MALIATGWLGCASPSGPGAKVDAIVAMPDAATSDGDGPGWAEGDRDAAPLDGASTDDGSLPEASLADVTTVSQADAIGDAPFTDVDHEGGVGSRVYEAWANWPMPNGPGTGLPNPQQYDLSTPGVVHDLVTGLFWEREGYQDELAWADADLYCRHLRVGAFRDFRLPSRIELVSLYDTGATGRSLFPSVLPMPPFPANLDFEVALSTLSPDGISSGGPKRTSKWCPPTPRRCRTILPSSPFAACARSPSRTCGHPTATRSARARCVTG